MENISFNLGEIIPIADNKKILNEDYTIEIVDDILMVNYHCKIVNLDVMKRVIKDRFNLSNGKSYPVLAEGTSTKYWDREARDYSGRKENLEFISAGAFVVTLPLLQTLVNLYLTIFFIKFPSKTFSDRDEAIEWLKSYR